MTPQIFSILISKLTVKEDILESRKVGYAKVPGSTPTHIAHSRHCHLTTNQIELAGLMSKDIKTSRSATAAEVLRRDRGVVLENVYFNLQTNLAHVYHMGTHTCTPHLETCRKKKHMAKILQVPRQISLARK